MDIQIRGLDKLNAKLGRLEATRTFIIPMHQATKLVQAEMADYPSPPPQSTYRRTGTLGRRWTTDVERIGDTVRGKVGNVTEYAPFVQAEKFQAAIHRGRWQTDERVLRDNTKRITALFQRAVDKALAR